MKKILTLSIGLVLSGIFVHATVRTVSNNSLHPAQYTSINTAIQDSDPGDTILVFGNGSAYQEDYGTVNIDRKITLIGAGYNNPYGKVANIATLNFTAGTFNSSNSYVAGFYIENIYYRGSAGAAKLTEGIVVERCQLQYVSFYEAVTYRDDTIRNCLFKDSYVYFYDYLPGSPYENIQIHNNIFDNEYIRSYNDNYNLDSVYFRNNVFVNRTAPNRIFDNTKWLTMENNIFYAAEPQGCTECAFNHNLTFANNDNVLDGTGNPGSIGTGNIENQNPDFTIYPIGGGAFSYSHDLHVGLVAAKTGGTDGKEIGIYGGMLPYDPGLNPAIPQMTEITFPGNASSVKVGGTLNVTFKAKKQD